MSAEETQGQTANGAPPPDYDSLFGKLKQLNSDSSGAADYSKKSVGAILGACGCCFALFGVICCCGLGLALPIAEIVIGALYIYDCPIENRIPLYLIIGGACSIVAGTYTCGTNGRSWKDRIIKRDEETGEQEEPVEQKRDIKQSVFRFAKMAMSIFLFVWLCMGTAWTVSARPLYTNEKFINGTSTVVNPLYCQETVFQFAFWVAIGTWILAGAVVVLLFTICFCICCIRCCSKDQDRE